VRLPGQACIKTRRRQGPDLAMVPCGGLGDLLIHDDHQAVPPPPYVGAWAYSHTECRTRQGSSVPSHISMIHRGDGRRARLPSNVIPKPETYGAWSVLTSPEMQLACNQVAKVMDATGATM